MMPLIFLFMVLLANVISVLEGYCINRFISNIPRLKSYRSASDSDYGVIDDFLESELGPPPDLPSLLLKNRIIYVGSPLVTAVSELVVAQLLYLNFRDNEMITLYINSPGSSVQREYTTRDTDAFAIADTMMFIKAPIRTVCVGKAYGTAAMLLSLGQKGCRYCLPNASIMLNQPRSYAQGQATDIAIQAKEVLKNREYTVELLSKACARDPLEISSLSSRATYFSGKEALELGIIDKILEEPTPPERSIKPE